MKKPNCFFHLILFILSVSPLITVNAHAVQSQSFIYQAKLYDSSGSSPLTSTINVYFKIYDPSGNCLLYKEYQTGIDLSLTNGILSAQVGAPVGSAKRYSAGTAPLDVGNSMATIYTNSTSNIPAAVTASCPAGFYTPLSNDGRVLEVTWDDGAGGHSATLPLETIGAVPSAIVAETLSGIPASGFAQISTNVTQAHLETLTAGATTDASSLHNHDSLYMKLGGTSNINAGSGNFYTTGNIGIGTSTPGYSLEIQGTPVVSGSNQSLIGAYDKTALAAGNGGGASFGGVYDSTGNKTDWAGIKGIKENSTTGNAAASLVFSTSGAAPGSNTEKARIDSSGNFGIGTNSPSSTLDVNGALTMRGMAAPSVSAAGQGRIYFDSTSNTFKVSQNNGSYADLGTGASGTFVTKSGDSMSGALTINNGTQTASTPVLSLSQTWNNVATTFTGILANITDTASSATSKLLDLQVGGVSKFSVSKTGVITGDGSGLTNLPSGSVDWAHPGAIGSTTPSTGAFTTLSASGNFSLSGLTQGSVPYLGASGLISEDNANFFYQASTHNLGIGTAAPAARLDVQSTLSASSGTEYGMKLYTNINASGTQGYTNLYVNTTETAVGSGPKLLADFQVAGTSKFKVDNQGNVTAAKFYGDGSNLTGISSSAIDWTTPGTIGSTTPNTGAFTTLSTTGNVGIGTASSSLKLTVQDSSSTRLQLASFDNSYASPTTSTESEIFTKINGINMGVVRTSYVDANNGILGFASRDAGDLENDMVIRGGKVGIGTTNPANKLTVAGTIEQTSGGIITSSITYTGTDSAHSIVLKDGGVDKIGYYEYGGTLATGKGHSFYTGGAKASQTLRMQIADDGTYFSSDVGIGTNVPTAKLDLADTTLSGSGALAGSILNAAQTWNTTGTPTAIKLNVTDTASNAASKLLDLQVGGVSKFNVDKTGKITGDGSGITNLSSSAVNWAVPGTIGSTTPNTGAFTTLSASGNVTLSGLTSGSVPFINSSKVIAEDNASFFWDATNKRLGIGTSSPAHKLNISDGTVTSFFNPATNKFDFGTLGAHSLGFYTNSTEAMRILSGGNVGIGTASPARLLTINGAANNTHLLLQTTNSGSAINNGLDFVLSTAGDAQIWNYQNATMQFGTNNLERMRIDANGNVGIGTSSPGAPLDVAANLNSNWAAIIQNNGTTNAHGLYLNLASSSTGVPLRVSKNNTSYLEVINNGNVGIGTASPGYNLDIQAPSANMNLKSTTGTNAALYKAANGSNSSYFGAESSVAGSTFVSSLAYSTVLGNFDSKALQFGTNSNINMTILPNGNVGIGTTNPSSALDVNGTINATDIKIGGTSIAAGQWTSSGSDIYRSAGKVGIGLSSPNAPLHLFDTPSDASTNTINLQENPVSTASGTYYHTGISIGVSPKVSSGVTNSGYERALLTQNLRNYSNSGDAGTVTYQYGNQVQYGHYDSDAVSPQTTNSYGLMIAPYSKSGTITNMFDIYLASPATGGTVTNRYGIYQANSSNNYFAGNIGIGATTPAEKLHINGGKTVITSDSGTYGQFQINAPTVTTEATMLFGTGGSGVNAGGYTNVGVIGLGAYSNAKDTLVFGTGYSNGTMFLKSDKLGIGTYSPVSKVHSYLGASGASPYQTANTALTLENSSRATLQFLTPVNQDAYVMFGNPDNANRGYLGYSGSGMGTPDQMVLSSSGTFALVGAYGGSGNVGIGTNSPGTKLQVSSTSTAPGDFNSYPGYTVGNVWPNGRAPEAIFTHPNTGTSTGGQYTYRGGIALGDTGVGIYSVNPNPAGSSAYGDIRFHTSVWNGTGYTNIDRMIMDQSGNLSIGNATYGGTLLVNSGATNSGLSITTGNTTNDPYFSLARNNNSSDRFYFAVRGGSGSSYLSIWDHVNGTTDQGIILKGNSVGIGNTNPSASYKLEVNGSVRVQNAGYSLLDTVQGSNSHMTYSGGKTSFSMDSAGTGGYGFTTYSGGYAERFTILSNGNVGVGTTTPSAQLTVQLPSGTNGKILTLGRSAGAYYYSLGMDSSSNFSIYDNDGTTVKFNIQPSGNAWLQGTLTQASDARLKKDITPLSSSLEQISKLQGVSYYWKDEKRDPHKQLGLIAQEVEKVFPEAVQTNADGYKSVAYTSLIAPIIEGVKDLYSKVKTLLSNDQKQDARLLALEKENAELKARLDRLEQSLTSDRRPASLNEQSEDEKNSDAHSCQQKTKACPYRK